MKRVYFLLVVMTSLFLYANLFAQQNTTKAQLNHIALYVVNLKTSTDFYCNIVGLDTIPEPFQDGKHTWLQVGPNIQLHLIQGAIEKENHNKNSHLCFSVLSVEDFITMLRKHSIEYENWPGERMKITTRIDGVKQIYLKDPDGYWIEINDAKE